MNRIEQLGALSDMIDADEEKLRSLNAEYKRLMKTLSPDEKLEFAKLQVERAIKNMENE